MNKRMQEKEEVIRTLPAEGIGYTVSQRFVVGRVALLSGQRQKIEITHVRWRSQVFKNKLERILLVVTAKRQTERCRGGGDSTDPDTQTKFVKRVAQWSI